MTLHLYLLTPSRACSGGVVAAILKLHILKAKPFGLLNHSKENKIFTVVTQHPDAFILFNNML